MGLYDDKLNPTYEIVLVAFLPIKSVKIKYVIIKGAKKKPMHKKLHMGVSKQRDYVSGEEETKSPVVCHCGIDKYTADFTKDCCRKKKKYRQMANAFTVWVTRPQSTRCDLTQCDLNNHGSRRSC